MKIYTQNYNLNERTDKRFFCPPNSHFKIGLKATENGNEVALSNINLYDGTSDVYVEQRYHLDSTIPEGLLYKRTEILNNSGRTITSQEISNLIDSLDWPYLNREKTAAVMWNFQYFWYEGDEMKSYYFKWLKIKSLGDAGWYYWASANSVPLTATTKGDLSVGQSLVLTWNSSMSSAANVSGDVVFKNYGYLSSDGDYHNYKTYDISSDVDSKKYTIEVNGNQPYIISSYVVSQNQLTQQIGFTNPIKLNLTQNITDSTVFEI